MQFDSIDLSGANYDLTVRSTSPSPFMPPVKRSHVEVADKAHDFRAYLRPKQISCDCTVTGDDATDLQANLDRISKLLNPTLGLKELILDFPSDRYYNAKVSEKIEWEIITPKVAQGEITFICPDPLAYDNSQTSSDHNIDADPDTVTETPGGTAYIEPVYTLTAGENLTDVTIKVENTDTGEELQWTGSLADTEELEIDVANWMVKKEGSASMATVTGEFPRLIPGTANHIKVTAFSTTGTLNITYRDTYL